MRPAVPGDRDLIERLVADRFKWMAERGALPWPQSPADIADKTLSPRAPMWVLADDGGLPIGVTMLLERTGTAIFTEEERAESCFVLTNSVTDPRHAGRGLGTQIALWAVDRAAREGKQWVRRVTTEDRLVRYYESQGFTAIRRREYRGNLITALQRPAERLNVLSTRTSAGAEVHPRALPGMA
jgi:GNAT superfamily N-acetyltransferase